MIAIAIVLCLFLSSGLCDVDTCHPTESVKDLLTISGNWYEFQKTPNFMGIDSTCIMLDLKCTSSESCVITEKNFKTNADYGVAHALTMSDKSISFDEKTTLNVGWAIDNSAIVVIADCTQKNETMAVYTRNSTVSEDDSKKIDNYIKTLKYKGANMTLVDNTVCSAVMSTAPVFLLLSVVLYAIL